MLQNEDVGRIDSVCPVVMSKAAEVLLTQVLKDAMIQASKEGRKVLSKSDIEKAYECYLHGTSYQSQTFSQSRKRKRKHLFLDDENGNIPIDNGSPL